MTALAQVRRPLLLLLAIGVVTHFTRLSYPRQVVFDEVTFGKHVAAYCCTGERVFDVHPPHGKLLIAAGAKLGGFDGQFDFSRIGEPYGAQPVAGLRFVPALAGTLIPIVFVLFLRELGASDPTAFLGGLLVALDNALVVESRIIVFDGILIAATFGAVTCFLAAVRRRSPWPLLVAAGALAGLAVGVKLTGLVAPALIGICLIFGLGVVTDRPSVRVRQALVMFATAAVVYLAGWYAHWVLLANPGPGDAFYATTGHFFQDLWTAHRTMLVQNMTMTATHPDASRPWTWPLMKVAPYLWQGDGASIYLIGNPVVWWGTAVAFFGILVQIVILRPLGLAPPSPAKARPLPFVALAGYALSFLPLLPVTRVLFLYHYLTPLLFSLAFVLLWLERAGWASPGGFTRQRPGYVVVAALAVLGFLVVSPLTYGFSAGGYDEWLVSVIRSWR